MDNAINTEKLKLIQPDSAFRDEYLRYCDAFRSANEPQHPLDELAYRDFDLFIRTIQEHEKGIGLPPGFVPYSTFWLVREGSGILGNSGLRHRLTPVLEDVGGHIGYRIHPQERRKGYGTILLRMTLEKAREIGLQKVLVTCDTENTASAGVIQNNGGLLASQGRSKQTEKEISRYWIEGITLSE